MSQLLDVQVDTKLKLSALWTSTMFCYIYCDYFELYVPGKLEGMLRGQFGPLGAVTQGVLIGTSVLLLVPSLMIFLCLALPARYNRILNIVVGALLTLLMALLAYGAGWYFYKGFAAIEAVLTAMVVGYAWTWPKVNPST